MLLSYQLALLAADVEFFERSLRHVGLDAGLAGGLLMEMALSGCVTVHGDKIAVRGGDFADPLLNDVARSVAGRAPATTVRVLSDIERWSGGITPAVLRSMESLALATSTEGGFDSVKLKGYRFGGRRIVPSSPEPRADLLASLATAASTRTFTEDTAALLALALASGVWRPNPPEPYSLNHKDSLVRCGLNRISGSTRASVESIAQGVAARTLAARAGGSVFGPGT